MSNKLLDRLSAIPYTGAISDILDEMGFRMQVLPKEIQSLKPGQTLAGRAVTAYGVETTSTDPEVIFVPFLKLLGSLVDGDVIVLQPNGENCSHIGELSSETAKFRGARGAVIDGGARDWSYIEKLDFPVYAKYKTPADINGRWCLSDYNTPIIIGQTTIEHGDYIVGDSDGVVVIPSVVIEEVVAKAEACIHTENLVRLEILQGVHPLEAFRKYGRF